MSLYLNLGILASFWHYFGRFLALLYIYFLTPELSKGITCKTDNGPFVSVGVSHGYIDHYQGRGHSSRPTAVLINIHEPLIKCLVSALHHQLTSDHSPVCMCHCIFFGIKACVSKHHAFRLYRATWWQLRLTF